MTLLIPVEALHAVVANLSEISAVKCYLSTSNWMEQ
jgi:hypothetical protein